MRVVYVSTIERGGPLTHLKQLAPHVAEEGIDVHVLCSRDELAESFRALGVSAEAVQVGHKLDLRGAKALADFMVERGFPAHLLHVIRYGIEPASASGKPEEREALVAGVAANLEYWKGVDVLIEAARLADQPLRIEISGDGSLRGDLELQAREAGVEAHFNGFVSEPLAGIAVLVQPSRADTLPLAVLEAMA